MHVRMMRLVVRFFRRIFRTPMTSMITAMMESAASMAAVGEYALVGVGVATVAGDDEAGARKAQAQDGGDERDVQGEQLHAGWHRVSGVIGRKTVRARLGARLRPDGA